MNRLANQLPVANPEFPADWCDEFERELVSSGLRRVWIVTNTLLVIEIILLLLDAWRSHLFSAGLDALTLWRLAALVFLASYRLLLVQVGQPALRLRYFLSMGMVFSCWSSAVLAGVTGDLSTYAIGLLGVAAACPLPGRFNTSLFMVSAAALIGWLWFAFPEAGPHWSSNIVAACVIGIVIEKFTFRAALREFTHRKGIDRQRERADTLLYNVFPESVATSLKDGKRSVALHGEVTILFADIVGFTQLSTRLLPTQLLAVLEDIFGKFDQLAQTHGVEKIKTIGDAYMAICGAPVATDHQVERMADFALAIVQECKTLSAHTGFELAVRVGIHTGPVIAGVIGSSRLCYDLWGDSVNTAQRIESQGQPNAIGVSEPVYFKLRDQFDLEDRGLVNLKGKGPTRSYVLKGRRSAA
ncbi:MAG: adenylate/guanylate cyclase domain-containing protein [Rhodoferax sp.]|nr:adenylate/guanylate cyclase domain-containing protein [Rhodoferax sp.]